MAHLYVEAGLYWPNEAPQVSLLRVCQRLIQQGMTTVNYGDFAEPNEMLLTVLEQPDANIRGASFSPPARIDLACSRCTVLAANSTSRMDT